MKPQTALSFNIRTKTEADAAWLRAHLAHIWGGEPVLCHRRTYYPSQLPGFIAEAESPKGRENIGEVTYSINKDGCEIVTLSSLREGQGVGSALFHYVETVARAEGCRRLYLITTTDNLQAIGFYQKRGMRLVAVYPDELNAVRAQKPEIPKMGMNGILLQDEIRFEKRLV